MYGKAPLTPWCPFCGFTERETVEPQEITSNSLVKKENHIEYEDNMTETNCKSGGWWNPITKKCMGSGNGFIQRNP
jgi:hypothetical protein